MRRLITAALVLSFAPLVLAAGWNKAYFGATKPGSFATYRTTSTIGPPSTYTMSRRADQGGLVVIESYSEFADKVTPSSTTRYEMAKGFDVDRDAIDYMKQVVGMSMGVGKDGALEAMPAEVLTSIKAVPTYAATAAFKATETVDGKSCDRYTYTRDQPGTPSVESGDIWLNPTVPFGVVKHTTTQKDRTGKVMWTTETVLLSSGAKPVPATTMTAAPVDPTLKPMTLKAAYDAGLIYVNVEIAPADKRGDRLNLRIETKGKPLTLTVAAANTSLRVEIPFQNLVFNAGTPRQFELSDGKPATLVVNQVGTDRVVAGKFRISIYEGDPTFTGSATMDTVK